MQLTEMMYQGKRYENMDAEEAAIRHQVSQEQLEDELADLDQEPPCTCERTSDDFWSADACELCNENSDWNRNRAEREDAARAILKAQAMRRAADEIVSLWWTGPYALAKTAAVETIIRKHLEAA